jgi:predicted DNA-binding antitoxin AbrB/MazE fold protein
MSDTIDAIYDGGVFKPLTPLSLPDKARVKLTVQPAKLPPFEPQDEWERRLLEIGQDCGVSLSDEDLSRENLYD